MNDKKICVLGGDIRQLYAYDAFSEAGYKTKELGLDRPGNDALNKDSLASAVYDADVIVLPVPVSTDGIKLSCPLSNSDIRLDDIIDCLPQGKIVAGGKLSDEFTRKIISKKCLPFDYLSSERFAILNAVPTAEGAVALAINETKTTLFGSNCIVTGFGRIGRLLARYLKSLGANVTVFSRKEDASAWAKAEGYLSMRYSDLTSAVSGADIIFNTVPSVIIDKKALDNTSNDVVIIDLASSPGGVDADYAKLISRRVIYALSLPGKVAPKSAGRIIADCVLLHLKGVCQ